MNPKSYIAWAKRGPSSYLGIFIPV
jgi:hypothetical protein